MFILGLMAIACAVTCYECTGHDSYCGDVFTPSINKEIDCSKIYGAVNNGGCSKVTRKGRILNDETATQGAVICIYIY